VKRGKREGRRKKNEVDARFVEKHDAGGGERKKKKGKERHDDRSPISEGRHRNQTEGGGKERERRRGKRKKESDILGGLGGKKKKLWRIQTQKEKKTRIPATRVIPPANVAPQEKKRKRGKTLPPATLQSDPARRGGEGK